MRSAWSRGRAPATIANVGPGFDVFALAVQGPADVVALRPSDEDSLVVEGPDAGTIPSTFERNTAGIVLKAMRRLTGISRPLEVRVGKGIPAGRGLGSSAASCAAAALAFLDAFPKARDVTAEAVIRAAAEGEAAVAGRHYDNISGALLGGFVSIASTAPLILRREAVSTRIHIALAIPDVVLRTAAMRRVLPRAVSLRDGVSNVGKAATLALALVRGDAELAGRCLEDRFAEPRRIRFLEGYAQAREAALGAGATGFALSGSGSTVFALASSRRGAEQSAKAMRDAFEDRGTNANVLATQVDNSIPLRRILRAAGPGFSLVTK